MREQYPRAALFGTEARTLFSTIRGRDYHLSVALPDSYTTSPQAYPVMYVLDGDYNFGVAAGLTRFSNWFRNVPELIIVGIGYDIETAEEFVALRDLDFDVPGVPGAASESVPHLFLDALTQEIRHYHGWCTLQIHALDQKEAGCSGTKTSLTMRPNSSP